MREYLVVLPIDPFSLGKTYARSEPLPLHCTVMPWFPLSSENALHLFEMGVEKVIRKMAGGKIELVSEDYVLFGRSSNIPAYTVKKNDALTLLHNELFVLLVHLGSVPRDLRWIGAGYQPHVSSWRDRTFSSGSVHHADQLLVIERDTEKRIKKEVRLRLLI